MTFVNHVQKTTSPICLDFKTVTKLSKIVCLHSEIFFESTLNGANKCTGFCETRKQVSFQIVSGVIVEHFCLLTLDFGCATVLMMSMDKFLQKITDSVGTQFQGINSSIVKMKEEDDRYKQFSERITNMEREILDMDEEYENRSDEPRGAHGDQNQGKAVITGSTVKHPNRRVMEL